MTPVVHWTVTVQQPCDLTTGCAGFAECFDGMEVGHAELVRQLKCGLHGDRLSDHRFMANFFRLYLHAMTLNMLVRLRQAVAESRKQPIELGLPNPLPAQALDEPDRGRYFNRRRDRDPLGEGFASTWRTRLIKVAAEVVTSARRVVVRLSASWPHLEYFVHVSQAILNLPPAPASG